MERNEVGGVKIPSENTTPWANRLLPSLQDALFLVVFLFLIVGGKDLLGDADTAWHIGIGRYILETGTVPDTGIFSYTAANMPWMAHEWLTELIFAVIHKFAGLNGIVLLAALAIAYTHSTFYGFLLSRGVNTALALHPDDRGNGHDLCPLACQAPYPVNAYSAFLVYGVGRVPVDRKARHIYLLPLVTILWVNLHGGFMAGLLLIAVYWSGKPGRVLFFEG